MFLPSSCRDAWESYSVWEHVDVGLHWCRELRSWTENRSEGDEILLELELLSEWSNEGLDRKKFSVKLLFPSKFQRGQSKMLSVRILVHGSTFAERVARWLLDTSLNDAIFVDALMGSQIWSTSKTLCFLRKEFCGDPDHQSQKRRRVCPFQNRSRQDWISNHSEPIPSYNHDLMGITWSDLTQPIFFERGQTLIAQAYVNKVQPFVQREGKRLFQHGPLDIPARLGYSTRK